MTSYIRPDVRLLLRGVTRKGARGAIPRTVGHCRGAKSLRGMRKSPNTVTSTLFNTVHLLTEDLSFEHGDAKLASCPGRHQTSLHPCCQGRP